MAGLGRCSLNGRPRLPVFAEPAKVGVLEVVAVLQAVAQEAVETDVRQPDQAEGQDERPVLPPPENDHDGWERGGVGHVMGHGTGPCPCEVTGHSQIGEQFSHHPQLRPCGVSLTSLPPGRLQPLVLGEIRSGKQEPVPADALFVLIGAHPHTSWLPPEIARNAKGFLLTAEVFADGCAWPLERRPIHPRPAFPEFSRPETCGTRRSNGLRPRWERARSQCNWSRLSSPVSSSAPACRLVKRLERPGGYGRGACSPSVTQVLRLRSHVTCEVYRALSRRRHHDDRRAARGTWWPSRSTSGLVRSCSRVL
jgi:hypothetical protein